MKSELLRAKLRGEVSQADYAQANAKFGAEISILTEKIALTNTEADELRRFRSLREGCAGRFRRGMAASRWRSEAQCSNFSLSRRAALFAGIQKV
jgi:hypothetical protein